MKKNRGFSLIELIVIIAIMSILTGILTPMFVKYANDKRQQACRQNREEILGIYEKSVYAMSLQVTQDDLDLLLEANDTTGTMAEYTNQVKDYLMCPKEEKYNQYEGYIDGSKAYITCKCHSDDVCMVDFAGWEGMPDEMLADKGFSGSSDASLPDPNPDPELPPKGEGGTPVAPNKITSVWPYRFLQDGELDPRWAKAKTDGGSYVGITDTATVFIPLPKYSHFKAQSGKEYFIWQKNGSENINGTSTDVLRVKYTLSDNPETMIQGYGTGNDLTWMVALSGIRYNNVNLTPPVAPNSKTNNPNNPENWEYVLYKGDVVVVYYDFVYFKDENGQDTNRIDYTKTKKAEFIAVSNNSVDHYKIPNPAEADEWGETSGGLYYLPKMVEKIDDADWGL